MALTLGDLERRVTALEAQATGAETLSPNYLTVDAAGHVGASFTGLINALGLILPAGVVSGPPLSSQIQWTRQADGALIADLLSYESGTVDVLQMDAKATAANYHSLVQLDALGFAGGQTATLYLSSANNALAQAKATVLAGSHTVMLVDDAGESSFLQLPSPKQLIAVNGTLSFTWPGSVQAAVVGTVTLPSGPYSGIEVLLGYDNTSGTVYTGGANVQAMTNLVNPAHFQIVATAISAPAASTAGAVHYLALCTP
jgi:hypothetical protein